MNPNPQVQTQPWDDEIDLRQLIETLLQRKWMIAGLVIAAVAVAAVYSFFVLPPRYESSIVVALPSATASDNFGMSTQAYEAMASNIGVLGMMIRNGNLDMELHNVGKRLKVQLDANPRLLRVTAHGTAAAEAEQLARLWQQAFQGQLLAYAENVVGSRLRHAESNLQQANAVAQAAAARLEEFERENSPVLKQARLSRWENELITTEAKLQELTEHSIPSDTARVAYLEEVLASITPTLDASNAGGVVLAIDAQAGVTTSDVTILNPIYLELNQDLSRTRTRLSANEQTARLLRGRLAELPAQIDVLRADVATLRTTWTHLRDDVANAERLYEDMRRNYQNLSVTHGDIEQLTAVTVLAEPMLPSGPVAPRKMLNMALAAFLGAFVGVGVAFFQQFWNGRGEPTGAN